jgi:hypothetical protein
MRSAPIEHYIMTLREEGPAGRLLMGLSSRSSLFHFVSEHVTVRTYSTVLHAFLYVLSTNWKIWETLSIFRVARQYVSLCLAFEYPYD